MACVWVYPSEILPLKIRAKGASLAAELIVVEITPSALANIGWKTYVIFAVLNLANACIVWCFYPEAAGQPLESIDRLVLVDEPLALPEGKSLPFHRKFQWSVVARAAVAVDCYEREGADYSYESEMQVGLHNRSKVVRGTLRI